MEPKPTRCIPGRAAASSPLPPPRPSLPLPLPSALMPPKKRRFFMPTPRKAATPPPPPPAPAVETLAIPAASSPPTPQAADVAGLSTAPTTPLVVAGAERSVAQPPNEPSTAPPPVVRDDAVARSAAARKVRKVVKRVFVKKIVPKGTFSARKAAAAAAATAGVASSETGGEAPTDEAASDQDGGVGNEQNLNESVAEKPATDCNAVALAEESLCEEEVVVGEGASEPATDCGDGRLGDEVVGKGVETEEVGMSERQKRMTMEVFVGGLHRDAKEEDVRAVFGKAGEITEVRMIMNPLARKNKGFCFVRYHEAAQAKRAIAEFGSVKICGNICRAAAPVGNDRIFLENINKKWKKEDVLKLLRKIGIENIDSVTLMSDSNNPVCNRGFALLGLETSRDAWMAYKKLSQKNAFGEGLNIRVAWAEPLNDPDEKDMQVKSIFVDGIPTSWDHAELKENFKKHGKIESVVLSRDMPSAQRKDFAFINYITHEAALSCLESFNKQEFTENGSKVNIKVSLAKHPQKSKQINHKSSISGKGKTKALKIRYPVQDYTHIYSGEKRPFSTLGDASFYPLRGHSRPRHEGSTYTTAASCYGVLPPATAESSPPQYHDSNRYPPSLASYYGVTGIPISSQVRQASSRQLAQFYRSRQGKKY